jgi:hypothetical protein
VIRRAFSYKSRPDEPVWQRNSADLQVAETMTLAKATVITISDG